MVLPVTVSLSVEYMASISSRRPRTSQAVKLVILESLDKNGVLQGDGFVILDEVAGVASDASALVRTGI